MKKIILVFSIISFIFSVAVSFLSSDFVVKNRIGKNQKIITATLKEKEYALWFEEVGKYQAPTDYWRAGGPREIDEINKQIETAEKNLRYWQSKENNRSFNFLIASYLAVAGSLLFSFFGLLRAKEQWYSKNHSLDN
ncbi:MAG: hypothetical protein WC467_04120 [Patescibacteria group bacterium]